VLTPYMPRAKTRKEKNLLSMSEKQENREVEKQEVCHSVPAPPVLRRCSVYIQADVIVPHWNSVRLQRYISWTLVTIQSQNLTLALISDAVIVPYSKLPPVITEHIHIVHGARDATGRGLYMPIIFPNDFWHLRSQYQPVNETTSVLPLHIVFHPMSYMKFQILASMTHGFNEAAAKQGGATMAELDEIKRMFVETNPWFLGLTALVSVLHMV
jgi:hypothetical protein